ncbi:MAG: VOC family protein [Bacteroidetes bacterium]|nr:MAG: VOC family protein [Bacteroidota bacterium]
MNLNQVTVPSQDLARAIPFYQQLGLELIVHTHAHYARFVCPEGGATFSLQQVDVPISEPGIHVYFECEKLDEKVRELMAAGIAFDALPEDKPWLWREAHLRDPDGNHLILYYAGENRLNPPWRLKD